MPQNTDILNTPIPEVNDLIGRPPSWILRSGISMIALVTLIIFSIAYFIKYPDKISGKGALTSTNPPIELISQTQGYIEEILVEENQEVIEGDRLIYIKNTTNPDQINVLLEWIEEFETINDPRKYLNISIPENLQLGTLQNDYAALTLKFNELQQTLNYGMPFQQINNLSEEIIKIRQLNKSMTKEKQIYANELALEEKDYNRSVSLQKDGVISLQDKEQSESKLLQKQRQYESMENTIIQNNIRIENLELEKLKIQGERANLIKTYQFTLHEIIARIRANVEHWTQTYTIEAPIGGSIALLDKYYKNANVKQGDILGHIIPASHSDNYFISNIPIQNIGKVSTGQKVLIKLDAYPHKEFGMLRSEVASVSHLPQRDQEGNAYYEVIIKIPDSLVTDIGKPIPYKPNMTATLEIITEDKTILERIFDQIISLIKHQE